MSEPMEHNRTIARLLIDKLWNSDQLINHYIVEEKIIEALDAKDEVYKIALKERVELGQQVEKLRTWGKKAYETLRTIGNWQFPDYQTSNARSLADTVNSTAPDEVKQ